MHTASKVMLILGAVITVAGIVMFAVGSSAVAWDPIGDAEWEGKSGTFNDDATLVYSVYSEASSCDSITYTILDGDNSAAVNQEYDCDDSTQSADGYKFHHLNVMMTTMVSMVILFLAVCMVHHRMTLMLLLTPFTSLTRLVISEKQLLDSWLFSARLVSCAVVDSSSYSAESSLLRSKIQQS